LHRSFALLAKKGGPIVPLYRKPPLEIFARRDPTHICKHPPLPSFYKIGGFQIQLKLFSPHRPNLYQADPLNLLGFEIRTPPTPHTREMPMYIWSKLVPHFYWPSPLNFKSGAPLTRTCRPDDYGSAIGKRTHSDAISVVFYISRVEMIEIFVCLIKAAAAFPLACAARSGPTRSSAGYRRIPTWHSVGII
jgi:hypothetical protein